MNKRPERRTERRLHYHWPIWFTEDAESDLSQGQMADITSVAAAFTCHAGEHCPHPGQHVTARFSVPLHGTDGAFDMVDFVRSGHVHRVDVVNDALRRVAMCFSEDLPFRPGEQETEQQWGDAVELLEPALV
jgi:hypothetical protein